MRNESMINHSNSLIHIDFFKNFKTCCYGRKMSTNTAIKLNMRRYLIFSSFFKMKQSTFSSSPVIFLVCCYLFLTISQAGLSQQAATSTLGASASAGSNGILTSVTQNGATNSPSRQQAGALRRKILPPMMRKTTNENKQLGERSMEQNLRYNKWLQDKQQREAESLQAQLLDFENQPTNSLADCAQWFSLNSKYKELINKQQRAPNKYNPQSSRESEIRKKDECDNLDKFFTETRSKMNSFNHLLRNNNKQLEYVGALIGEYLDLNYAADVNEQLAQEFYNFKLNNQVRLNIDKLENFVEFITSALRLSANHLQQKNAVQPQDESLVVNNNQDDELFELDTTLKRLVDQEETLSEEEFANMSELGTILEEILVTGKVDLNSARFRYLNGTLDAVRAVILRKLQQPFPPSNHLIATRQLGEQSSIKSNRTQESNPLAYQ